MTTKVTVQWVMGDKVDDDVDNNDYGNGRQQ
jgi:hypothetical protein